MVIFDKSYCCGCVQIAGLLSSLVVLVVVVAIGFIFQPLPQVGGADDAERFQRSVWLLGVTDGDDEPF